MPRIFGQTQIYPNIIMLAIDLMKCTNSFQLFWCLTPHIFPLYPHCGRANHPALREFRSGAFQLNPPIRGWLGDSHGAEAPQQRRWGDVYSWYLNVFVGHLRILRHQYYVLLFWQYHAICYIYIETVRGFFLVSQGLGHWGMLSILLCCGQLGLWHWTPTDAIHMATPFKTS